MSLCGDGSGAVDNLEFALNTTHKYRCKTVSWPTLATCYICCDAGGTALARLFTGGAPNGNQL
eukprot:4047677-Amphidinium_carterae.3